MLPNLQKLEQKGFPALQEMLADLLGIGSSAIASHIEHNILQTSSLSNLPMNTSASGDWHGSGVNYEIANLPEEVILSTD